MAITGSCHHSASRGQITAVAFEAMPPPYRCDREAGRADGAPQRTDATLPIVDCAHPGRPHRHGTRVAYVKDRCRCRDCTAANTAHSRQVARAKALGRWHPYTDISPVRSHIAQLRAAHLGYRQIARAARTSTGHIREIAATSTRSAGRPPVTRIRDDLANRILAIRPEPASISPNAKVPALGSRRRIQALVAVGWPLPELAPRLHYTARRLESILAATHVTVRTARAVDSLYDALWDQHPPTTTDAQRDAVTAARQRATEAHWAPPMAWDDIDTDAHPAGCTSPNPTDIDEIAIDRAVHGNHIHLADLTPGLQTWAESLI